MPADTPRDPSAHEAHALPLANRIADQIIGDWLNDRTGTALATVGEANDYERGMRQGIEQMRHLYLSGFEYTLVPALLDALRRAGLLVDDMSQVNGG